LKVTFNFFKISGMFFVSSYSFGVAKSRTNIASVF